MSRIPPLAKEDRGPVVRHAMRQARKRLGQEPEPFAAVAHHRRLFLAQGAMELALEGCREVPERVKELAVLRTAMVVGCEFCCDIGSFLSRQHGIDEDELRELATWRESERFSALDRLALELAEAMSRTPDEVSDELVDALRRELGDAGAVELMTFVAWENFRARLNGAMGFGSQGYSVGSFCVAPDREGRLSAEPAVPAG